MAASLIGYIRTLDSALDREASDLREIAARYSVENVAATGQVSVALEAMGEVPAVTTPSGAKVDRLQLCDVRSPERC